MLDSNIKKAFNIAKAVQFHLKQAESSRKNLCGEKLICKIAASLPPETNALGNRPLGSLEPLDPVKMTAPLTEPDKSDKSINKQLDMSKITGAAPVENVSRMPLRSPNKPAAAPSTPLGVSRVPHHKIGYCRNTGIVDHNGDYVNVDDVSLLAKLGFEVDDYRGLEKTSEVLDVYSYVEKVAGVPKAVARAVDKGEAFSGEFLKDMDYKLPEGYEVKGDLCCPVEKEKKTAMLEKESSEKPGLWANIRAKKERGGKPAKPGDEAYPDKKQWDKLTKEAMTLSATKGILRAFRAGGGTLAREAGAAASYIPGSNTIKLPVRQAGYSPLKNLWHEYGHSLDRGNMLSNLPAVHTDKKIPTLLNFEQNANRNALAEMQRANVPQNLQQQFIDYSGPAYQTYASQVPLQGVLGKYLPAMAPEARTSAVKPFSNISQQAGQVMQPHMGKDSYLPALSETYKTVVKPAIKNLRKTNPSYDSAFRQFHNEFKDTLSRDAFGNLKQAAVAAWQRSEGKNPEGGLNAKGRASYKRETGGTLKAPVTESNPKGERASRQHSFCSRMCGMKSKNTGSKAQGDPDSRINKSLRKWNCKCGEEHESLYEKVACLVKEASSVATHELKSSNIKAVGYDKKEKELEVHFHSGGEYKYKDVPKSLFDRIRKAKSPGGFFHKHIKKDNPFEYEKIAARLPKMKPNASQQLLPGFSEWKKKQPFNHAEEAFRLGRISAEHRDKILSGRLAEETRPKFEAILAAINKIQPPQ